MKFPPFSNTPSSARRRVGEKSHLAADCIDEDPHEEGGGELPLERHP